MARLDAIPDQGIVRRIMNVRLHHRTVRPQTLPVFDPLFSHHDPVDLYHQRPKALPPDSRYIFVEYFKRKGRPPFKFDKRSTYPRIFLRIFKLPIIQLLELLIQRCPYHLLYAWTVLPPHFTTFAQLYNVRGYYLIEP